jgi:anti-anti-sigma factor
MTAQLRRQLTTPAGPVLPMPRVGVLFSQPPTVLSGEHPTAAPGFEATASPVTGQLYLCGELDVTGREALSLATTEILAGNPAEVVVDLSDLRFIDASGIGLLIGLRKELAAHHATMRITNPSPRTTRIFFLCGLSAMLPTAVAS